MNLWTERNWSPMLLHEIAKPFNDENYLFELKLDGERAIIFASQKEVKIQSRNQKDITYLYPELQQIKNLVTSNTIFDGEIVVFENGYPSFKDLQKRFHLKEKSKIRYESEKNPVVFMCFDILYEKKSLINLPLIERKKRLEKYAENDVFLKTKVINKNGIELFKMVKKHGLEGIIAKKKDSIYQINMRVQEWLKIKNKKTENFLIGGYIEKEKNAVISLLLGEKKKNKLVYVGKVSMGKKNELYKKIKEEHQIKKCPFENCEEQATFLNPSLTCEVEFLERTKSGMLRHPIFRK